MARVKRGVTAHAKHKKTLDAAKGFYGRRKNTIRAAKAAVDAAKAQGVPMPAAAATSESIARMVGRGHDHIDFAVLLKEVAADSGLELKSENKQIDDGLAS